MTPQRLAESVVGWLAVASWQLALFVVLVAIATWLLRRASPRLRHGLWMLVLIKALLPTTLGVALVAMPWSFGRWGVEPIQQRLPQAAQHVIAPAIDTPVPATLPPVAAASPAREPSPGGGSPREWWQPVLAGGWALGAFTILASGIVGYSRLRRDAAALPSVEEGPVRVALESAALAVGLRDADGVDLRLANRPTGPFLFGLRRPVVVLPNEAVQDLAPEELRGVLAHELVHWRRRDTWVGWWQLAVTALFWFHPLVWWAAARLREERECCCDDAVLRVGAAGRDAYGEAIIRSLSIGRGRPAGLSSPRPFAATGLVGVFERGAAIQQRVEDVMKFQPGKGRFGSVSKGLLAAFAAVFLPMAAVIGATSETEVARVSLDTLADAGLRIEPDRETKIEGEASIRITTKWPTTVCLAEVENPDVEGETLIYSARVKSDLERTASLEMWAHVNGGVYFSRNPNVATFGKTDWKELRIPFYFQAGSRPDKVTLNLILGSAGTVWVDDIRLLKKGAATNKKTTPVKKELVKPTSPYPAIVDTVPAIGATEVDPSVTEIRVTFDRDMSRGMSWTGGREFHPADAGRKAHWADSRTCVLPVKLAEGRFYRVGINSKSYQNFKSAHGEPAEHRVIAFTTEGAKRSVKNRTRVPKVTNLKPAAAAEAVDPNVKSIEVTFDTPMAEGMSWVRTAGAFPDPGEGRARWSRDRRTCTLPVALSRGETYELSLNGPHHVNFQSRWGVPAPATLWSFSTAE